MEIKASGSTELRHLAWLILNCVHPSLLGCRACTGLHLPPRQVQLQVHAHEWHACIRYLAAFQFPHMLLLLLLGLGLSGR